MFPSPTADRLRGVAVGATAGVLAVAAHGIAGGDYPSTTAATLLLALCGTAGAVAARSAARNPYAILALLGLAQVAGHSALTVTADHVHRLGFGSWSMLSAHVGATVTCGVLIVVADRLFASIARTVRVVVHPRLAPVTPSAVRPPYAPRQVSPNTPTPSAISRRGPPVPCAS